MHLWKTLLLSSCVISALSVGAVQVANAESYGPPEVRPAVHSDSLPSLKDVIVRKQLSEKPHIIPVWRIPLHSSGMADAAVQSNVATLTVPATLSNILGVGVGFTGPAGAFTPNSAPPDTDGAVGATQYVQEVNESIAVFDKTTKAVVYGPVPTNTLWQGFGGDCENFDDGDGIVVYDKTANRWIVSQLAYEGASFKECVAVSKTSDATGGYWRYAFDYGTSLFADYPKLGVWSDGYYITFNMFGPTAFAGAQLCAFPRTAMLSGHAATQQCFQLSDAYGGVLPADRDGAVPPPAGSPEYFVNFGTNSLNLWKFHVDWATPANTTLTQPVNLPVAAFSTACAFGDTCIPQLGTSQRLDVLSDRLMFRLSYRNFRSHESLVLNHTVRSGARPVHPNSGIRWYELRNPGTTPVVYQQSTYSPDSNYRWMGSIAMDKVGNMALGYSESSPLMHPGIWYTGRLVTDPLNTMEAQSAILDSTSVVAGSQNGGLNRWGDYSAMTVDPTDDCTFWYTQEYLQTDGSFNWSTRIASFKFPSCN
jgi:hypothetical protein